MSLCLSNEEFKTGLAEIDEPHERICKFINDLYALLRTEQDLKIVFNEIDNIISFIDDHNLFEEKLMLSYDYPRFAEHKEEHDKFKKALKKLVNELKKSKTVSQIDILMAKRGPIGWFFSHVSKFDKHLADFIKAHNDAA